MPISILIDFEKIYGIELEATYHSTNSAIYRAIKRRLFSTKYIPALRIDYWTSKLLYIINTPQLRYAVTCDAIHSLGCPDLPEPTPLWSCAPPKSQLNITN